MFNLDTTYTLNYGDRGGIICEGNIIMVSFINGEKLMGEYKYSDDSSLTIDRNKVDVAIDFDEIVNIENLED